MQKSLAKNSIYNIIYTVANILFPFVTSIYVSRILLPVGVGKVASAQNIASYFVTIAALGLPSYGVREFAKAREDKQQRNRLYTELLLLNVVSTTLAAIGFFALVFVNAGFNGEWVLYSVCGLSIFFNYLNIDWMYQGLEEYGYITGRSILIKGISLVALFIFVKTRQDYVVYALISSLATGGNYIFNIVHAREFVKISFSGIQIKRHIKPVLLIAAIIFLSSVYNKIDITMLNAMATDEAVGYYAYAQKTVNMVLTLANAITAALLPRLSYYYDNDKEHFYQLLNKGFQILCFTTFPMAIGMAVVAPQVVDVLYGEAFEPTAVTIQLMCPLILIKGFGDLFCYQLVYSTKNEKVVLPAAAAASTINVVANAVLIPVFLQNGAVIASVLSEFVTNAIQYIYIKKKIKFTIDHKILAEETFSTIFMLGSVLVLRRLNVPNVIGLFIEVIGGCCAYVFANIIMRNTLMFEIFEKIKSKNA